MVPKEFEHPRRTVQDVAVGPQGRSYVRTWQIGVFHPTEVAHRVFPPPTQLQGFLHVNYKFSPCDGVVCVGQIGSVSDVNQRVTTNLSPYLLGLAYKAPIRRLRVTCGA